VASLGDNQMSIEINGNSMSNGIVNLINDKITQVGEEEFFKEVTHMNDKVKGLSQVSFRLGYAACLIRLFKESLITVEALREHVTKE